MNTRTDRRTTYRSGSQLSHHKSKQPRDDFTSQNTQSSTCWTKRLRHEVATNHRQQIPVNATPYRPCVHSYTSSNHHHNLGSYNATSTPHINIVHTIFQLFLLHLYHALTAFKRESIPFRLYDARLETTEPTTLTVPTTEGTKISHHLSRGNRWR